MAPEIGHLQRDLGEGQRALGEMAAILFLLVVALYLLRNRCLRMTSIGNASDPASGVLRSIRSGIPVAVVSGMLGFSVHMGYRGSGGLIVEIHLFDKKAKTPGGVTDEKRKKSACSETLDLVHPRSNIEMRS